jgi:hypothetical protein
LGSGHNAGRRAIVAGVAASSATRRVTGFRRVALGNGKYLQLAITDEPGPRGGHTVGYVRTKANGEKVYPGRVVTDSEGVGGSANRRRRKHGRRLIVKRKRG